MVIGLLKTLVGSRNDRLLKQYRKVVAKVSAFEPSLQALGDAELQAKTADGQQNQCTAAGEKAVSVAKTHHQLANDAGMMAARNMLGDLCCS